MSTLRWLRTCTVILPVILILCTCQRDSDDWQAVDEWLDRISDEVTMHVAVHDAAGRELYVRNAGERVASASVIKIPILVELMRMAENGELSTGEVHTLTPDEMVGGAGELQQAGPGGTYTLEFLAREMIRTSDNTATNVLIRRIGMEQINALMDEAGMGQSVLAREMMDFRAIEEGRQNYTSAADMNRLLLAVLGSYLLTEPGSDKRGPVEGAVIADEIMLRANNPRMSGPVEGAEIAVEMDEERDSVSGRDELILSRESARHVIELLEGCEDHELIRHYVPSSIRVAHKTGTLAYVRGDSGILFTESPIVLTIFATGFADVELASRRIAELARIVLETGGR